MPLKVHELKTWPEHFQQVWDEVKKFEIRKNDRDFKVGDMVVLKEWDPQKKAPNSDMKYTGRQMTVIINYVFKTKGGFGISKTHCIFCWEADNIMYED